MIGLNSVYFSGMKFSKIILLAMPLSAVRISLLRTVQASTGSFERFTYLFGKFSALYETKSGFANLLKCNVLSRYRLKRPFKSALVKKQDRMPLGASGSLFLKYSIENGLNDCNAYLPL